MSAKHPVIAVTGSSGAGTTTVKRAFEHIFRRENITAAIIEGDSMHSLDRKAFKEAVAKAEKAGKRAPSHFGPEANHFAKIEEMFKEYGQKGSCMRRYYIHSEEEGKPWKQEPGTFTPFQRIEKGTDLLFYEGLHGGVQDGKIDVAKYVDLLVGVVPIVNLEWIQKIHRDAAERGYAADVIVDTIMRRMHDYVHYMTPQFSRTHVNFQRVPTVDTSNPFIARDIPTPDESFIVIRFRREIADTVDFPYLLNMIPNSFMSRPNTMVVPGGKMGFAMELILTPMIHDMIAKKKKAKK